MEQVKSSVIKTSMRSLSYNPLWKKLIDLKMTKTELAEKAGISRSTIAKMRKDEPVALDVIVKIANAIDCDVIDIISILPNPDSAGNGSDEGK